MCPCGPPLVGAAESPADSLLAFGGGNIPADLWRPFDGGVGDDQAVHALRQRHVRDVPLVLRGQIGRDLYQDGGGGRPPCGPLHLVPCLLRLSHQPHQALLALAGNPGQSDAGRKVHSPGRPIRRRTRRYILTADGGERRRRYHTTIYHRLDACIVTPCIVTPPLCVTF
eukprot:827284-Prorocentrum_minimum.AAC.1